MSDDSRTVADGDDFEVPYWECPYLARYESLPGHDPAAVCVFGCWDEPKCVTYGPWPERSTA